VQARVQEETENWFLTFSQKLKVIFGGFAIANPLDRGAAEVGLKGLDHRGFFIKVIRVIVFR
jgi:hypothetical protein